MYSRCIIDVFSPIDLDFYLFACLFLCLFVFESSRFTLHSNKIDMVVFFFSNGLGKKTSWAIFASHFFLVSLIIEGFLGLFGPFLLFLAILGSAHAKGIFADKHS